MTGDAQELFVSVLVNARLGLPAPTHIDLYGIGDRVSTNDALDAAHAAYQQGRQDAMKEVAASA